MPRVRADNDARYALRASFVDENGDILDAPVVIATHVTGITAAQITNWDTAYGWGDHSTQGYLTSETDPVFSASAASGVSSVDISNWDTAYGWGNHASAGYATTAALNSATANSSNWDTAYGWGDHAGQYLPIGGGTVTGSVVVNGEVLVDRVRCRTGQQLVLAAGEASSYSTGQTGEYVYVNAESGLQVNSSPDNWGSGWAGRKTASICASNGTSSFPAQISVTGHGNSSQWNTAYSWGDHGTEGYWVDGSSSLNATSSIKCGNDSSSPVGFTVNDGGGNANIVWNHFSNSVTTAGYNTARIVHNSDSTSGSNLSIRTGSGGVAPSERLRVDDQGIDVTGAVTASDSVVINQNGSLTATWDTEAALQVKGSYGGGVAWLDGTNGGWLGYVYNAGNNFVLAQATASASPSTKFEVNQLGNVTISGTLSASGYNKSNWDTAYGWGNHASAGYIQPNTTVTVDKSAGGDWRFKSSGQIQSSSGTADALEVFADNTNDAFMTFHIGNDYATNLGLDGGTNRLGYGGWSAGQNFYQFYSTQDFPDVARGITGQYGSFEIDGGGTNSYEGFSIGGRAVFMHNNNTVTGIYNDVNNHWLLRGDHNGPSYMYQAGVIKGYTYASGFRVTGNLLATSNVYAYYSDERLKTFTGAIESPLEKIAALHGVYYTHNDKARELGYEGSETQVGLIAQEVKAVMPECIGRAPIDDDGEGGSVSGEDYMTVDYPRLVPLLVEGIKELTREVEQLKEQLNALR